MKNNENTNTSRALIAALLLCCAISVISVSGCSKDKQQPVSPSDTAVSSQEQEEITRIKASEAVSVSIDGEKVEEVFLLAYNWYGEEFVSEDSFHKIMMDHYAPQGQRAPFAPDNAKITFRFDKSEGKPSSVRLTQYANTVRSDSGLPYDNVDIQPEEGTDSETGFVLSYRRFKMYYYLLECEWENGNTAKYRFAVEKTQ